MRCRALSKLWPHRLRSQVIHISCAIRVRVTDRALSGPVPDAEKFDAKNERCWIAERAGEVIGSVFLVKKSKSVAKLRLLLVEPSARGLGLGKRLVEECVAFALRVGYRKIVLWTQSELLAARHIYQRAGFKLAGEERHSSWGRKELVSEVWEKEL